MQRKKTRFERSKIRVCVTSGHYFWSNLSKNCIGGSHQLISSDVIDLMCQLIDLIYLLVNQFNQLA